MSLLRSLSWLAVKGKAREAACVDLGLRVGMASRHATHYFPIEGAVADSGWFLIVADGHNHRLLEGDVLATLSQGCEVLTCTVQESFLYSKATGWRDGQRVWSVTYEGEDQPGDVVAEGTLPVTFAILHQDLLAQSKADDAGDLLLDPLFEIPIEAVRQAVGYRPDKPRPAFEGRFARLEAVNPTVYQRLFGG